MKDKPCARVILIRSRTIDPAVNKMARALAVHGYAVTLLAWSREGKVEDHSGDHEYNLHRFNLKAPYYKLSLIFYLPVWWLYEFFFLMRHRADVVHACDFDTLGPAVLAGFITGARLCYTIYDFYADILPPQVPGALAGLVGSAEKCAIGFVDVLFLVDKSRYEQVRGAHIKSIEYIYNSPEDLSHAVAESENSVGNIFYAGYLDRTRGLIEIMEAVRGLDKVRLIVAGTGPARENIESNLGSISNLEYIGWIPYAEVINRTLNADVICALYDPDVTSNRYASPNKLFEAMMCGKPIIVNEGITASRIVAEEICGLVVRYGDVRALREAILKLVSDPELSRRLGRNGRKAYEERYSWDIMKDRLIKAYLGLIRQ